MPPTQGGKNCFEIDASMLSLRFYGTKCRGGGGGEEKENKRQQILIIIKKTKGIQLLNVSDISKIEASGDFCIATDFSGKRHTISQNLGAIFLQLNPIKFFKINRSEIINIDYIEHIESHFKNRLLIKMKGLKDKVMTSSSTTSEFRKWLE